jgi:hypothetical protein
MTKRYICQNKEKRHSFNGYDKSLMNTPLRFQADFPAVLTHQSEISKPLFKLMRASFQHGMGPYRFEKVIRIMMMEKFDELQLQYYISVDNLHPR